MMHGVTVPTRFAIRNTDNTNVDIITRSLFSYILYSLGVLGRYLLATDHVVARARFI